MSTVDQLERSATSSPDTEPSVSGRTRLGRARHSVLSRRSYRSILSTRSHRSILSIRSERSILSIGSAYSVLSIGSVGSVLSIASTGSFLSFASAFSGLSRLSLLSWMGDRDAPEARPQMLVVPEEPDLKTDPTFHTQT